MSKIIIIYFSLMYFMIGMIHTFVGSYNNHFEKNLNMDQEDVSVLISIQFTAFMIGVISSILIKKIFLKLSFQILHFLIFFIILLFCVYEHIYTVYILIFFFGLFAGLIESSIASYVFNYKSLSIKTFSYIESFFALGAFLLPLIVWVSSYYLEIRISIIFMLFINIISFFIVNKLSLKPNEATKYKRTSLKVKKCNIIFIILLWCFFYIGIETNFSNLLPYMKIVSTNLNYITVSTFWIGIIIGRFLYTILLIKYKVNLEKTLILLTVFSIILYFLLITLNFIDPIKIILLFFLSLTFSPMFPLGASIINNYSENKSFLTSLFIAVAGLGGTIGALIIKIALNLNVKPFITFFLLLLACLIFSILIKKVTDSVKK
ncbi:MFS transporter [Staphylococcus kloosii]|jgi:FHS family glucose/mannose:H+ symporter-like MFS transporter|uniref:MFS transporter n=1 Tax=Staphylococcus kloosii TaxID=29384 RepID=UPI00189CB9F4|nr:MFS transporter [Staphylococcus kloosii]MBF7025319.1 MFS transporter [Staphylococcus kloosii]